MRFLVLLTAVILVFGSVPALAQDQPPQPPGPAKGPPEPGDTREEGLPQGGLVPLQMIFRLPNLSEEQLGQICSEAYEIQAQSIQLRADLAAIKLKLVCLQRHDVENVDAGEIKKLYAESGRIEGEFFQLRQRYMKAVKAILTEEQMKMLESRRPGRGRRPMGPGQ